MFAPFALADSLDGTGACPSLCVWLWFLRCMARPKGGNNWNAYSRCLHGCIGPRHFFKPNSRRSSLVLASTVVLKGACGCRGLPQLDSSQTPSRGTLSGPEIENVLCLKRERRGSSMIMMDTLRALPRTVQAAVVTSRKQREAFPRARVSLDVLSHTAIPKEA